MLWFGLLNKAVNSCFVLRCIRLEASVQHHRLRKRSNHRIHLISFLPGCAVPHDQCREHCVSWARYFTLTVPLATQVIVTTNYNWTCIKRSPSIKWSVVKVPKITSLIIVILTCIKRSPLLSGCGQPLLSPYELFLLSWPVLSGHLAILNYGNPNNRHRYPINFLLRTKRFKRQDSKDWEHVFF